MEIKINTVVAVDFSDGRGKTAVGIVTGGSHPLLDHGGENFKITLFYPRPVAGREVGILKRDLLVLGEFSSHRRADEVDDDLYRIILNLTRSVDKLESELREENDRARSRLSLD